MSMFRPLARPRHRVVLGLLLTLVLAGGLAAPAGAQTRQETLIVARNIDDYVTNDPSRTYEYTSQMLDQSAYDTLVTVEAPDFTKIQPKLATKWEVSKDSSVFTFTLRSGAKFASGNPVTAQDVRFSFRRLKNLKDNPSFFMDPVKDIEVVKRNEEAVLERNANHWGPKPHFAKIVFRHVKDGTTQREMVERGDADVAHDFDPDIVAKIKEGPKIKLLPGLSMNQVYMAVNTNPEVSKELSDKRVRQAVSYAIDYDGIIKGLVRGAGEQPPAMIPLGLLGVDKAMARKRDLAKAKALLKDAGLPNGFDLKMNYWTAPLLGVPTEPLAAKLQADLGQAGIKVTLEPKERSVMISEYRAGKPALMLASWTPDLLDPDAWADAFYKKGGVAAKRVSYDNPKITDLIATAKRETDAKKRAGLYKEIQQIAQEDVPFIMLIQPKSYVGMNPAIKGYAIHPIWFVTLAKLSR